MKKTQQLGLCILIFLFMTPRDIPDDNPTIVAIPADSIQNTSTTTSIVQLPVNATQEAAQ